MKELLGIINDFFANILDGFMKIHLISNIIKYTLLILLLLASSFAAWRLIIDIINHLNHPIVNGFPFVLEFAENIFLYFLPIYVLFGFLKYYELDLERYLTDSSSKPDIKAIEQLHLSKKLFFSSVLSYITIKIIELLFFKNDKTEISTLISIGVFYITLIVFVISKNKKEKPAENTV